MASNDLVKYWDSRIPKQSIRILFVGTFAPPSSNERNFYYSAKGCKRFWDMFHESLLDRNGKKIDFPYLVKEREFEKVFSILLENGISVTDLFSDADSKNGNYSNNDLINEKINQGLVNILKENSIVYIFLNGETYKRDSFKNYFIKALAPFCNLSNITIVELPNSAKVNAWFEKRDGTKKWRDAISKHKEFK